MKRILTFAMAVLLIVALAVPAFAAVKDNTGRVFPDPVSVWDVESYPQAIILYNENKDRYELITSVYPFDKYAEGKVTKTTDELNPVEKFVIENGSWIHPYNDWGGYISEVKTTDVAWASYNIYDNSAQLWLATYPLAVAECDGTTCPATDANADGVCDDCGMVLSLRLTGYPTLPIVDGSNQHSVLTSDSGGYSYYVYYSPSSYTIEGIAGDQLLAKFGSNVNWKVFRCTDGRNWAENASSSGYQYGMGYTSDVTILSSSFDFYDESGNLFFPLPLWMEMGQMTEGEMGALTAETAGTMRVLAVCGVGLIALLVVLSLFGKRSLIFRN